MAIVTGSSRALVVVASDSAGMISNPALTWTSSAPSIASVSSAGVVTGAQSGFVTITATSVRGLTAQAAVTVTAPPLIGAYTVQELLPTPDLRMPNAQLQLRLNDSGLVVLTAVGMLWQNGAGFTVPGCRPLAINNLSHVLCGVPGTNVVAMRDLSIARSGTLTPLTASDSIASQPFLASTLNDVDAVAGKFISPSSGSNSSDCAAFIAVSGSCAATWKNGAVAVAPVRVFSLSFVTHLNNRGDLIIQDPVDGSVGLPPNYFIDGASRQARVIGPFVRALNNLGWMAKAQIVELRGPSAYQPMAELVQPDTTIIFGRGEATGLTDAGDVVGTLRVGPFLWSSTTGIALITHAAIDPGWTVTTALRINARGQILAQANHTDGRVGRWILLTRVAP